MYSGQSHLANLQIPGQDRTPGTLDQREIFPGSPVKRSWVNVHVFDTSLTQTTIFKLRLTIGSDLDKIKNHIIEMSDIQCRSYRNRADTGPIK